MRSEDVTLTSPPPANWQEVFGKTGAIARFHEDDISTQ